MTTGTMLGERRSAAHLLVAVAVAVAMVASAAVTGAAPAAAADDIGTIGPSYTGLEPTGTRPESKLWWHAGRWWGVLIDRASDDYHVFFLDTAESRWVDTGVTLDRRSNAHSDVLWDGSHVYVASHRYSSSPSAGYPSYLYRLSYDVATARFVRDTGYPVQINNVRSEALVIDKDSTGRLWATWVQGQRVYVTHSLADDRNWATPFIVPGPGTDVSSDDISSIVAFGGNRIGVMWSNQTNGSFFFATHLDSAPPTSWTTEVALAGTGLSDDHMNLKADSSGRVLAAVKTSRTAATDPLILLLTRSPAGGWSSNTVGVVGDSHTRPIVLLDEEHSKIHVLLTGPQPPATSGQGGGDIYEKTSALGEISFAPGVGTPIIRRSGSPYMNNVTSTKQRVSSTTGIVAIASNDVTKETWFSSRPLGSSAPAPATVTASFSSTTPSGPAPLAVTFTDTSSGSPTAWSWDFGDGGPGAATQHPTHTYTEPGTYTVSLTASTSTASDVETKVGYVTVKPPPTTSGTFTFSSAADSYVYSVSPSKNYGGSSYLRVMNDGSSAYRSYVKFTAVGIGGTVASARLRLYARSWNSDGGRVYTAGSDWTDLGITWSTAPGIVSGPLGAVGATATGTWVEIDVTTAIAGDGTYTFVLSDGSSSSAWFDSREGTNPAQLVVTTS